MGDAADDAERRADWEREEYGMTPPTKESGTQEWRPSYAELEQAYALRCQLAHEVEAERDALREALERIAKYAEEADYVSPAWLLMVCGHALESPE